MKTNNIFRASCSDAVQSLKIVHASKARRLFFLCWFTYFSTYLGKLNFSACMLEITRAEGFTKAQMGMIGTAFFLSYGFGQLVNGFLGDRLSPRKIVGGGMILSAVFNLFMPFCFSYQQMLVVWGVNGLAQSTTWSPIVRILSDMLPLEQSVRACVHMSTATALGTLSTYLVCALLLRFLSWRVVFYFSCAFLAISFILWSVGMERMERYRALYGLAAETSTRVSPQTVHSSISVRYFICSTGVLPIACAALIQGVIKDGIGTWTPTLLSEQFEITPAFSLIISTVLPCLSLVGVYSADWVQKKLFQNEVMTSAFFFFISGLAFLALFTVKGSALQSAFFLSVGNAAMLAVSTMLVSLVPLHFSKIGRTSTVSGLMNAFTYAGSTLSGYGVGLLSDRYNWSTILTIWGCISLIGLLFCLASRSKWNRFLKGM